MELKDDKHKVLNSIIMDIEKQKHIIDRTFAFIQSTLISLEANEKLEGEEKDWLIKDLREKLNEREKATATLTYLKYKKMRDEMQRLKMHGGPDDYLENLEKIKKPILSKATEKNLTQKESKKEDLIVKKINEVLDTKIRPAVSKDGGDIKFVSFENGKVKVELRGSCSGCPSSLMTLKNGVQNLLRHNVKDVTDVEAI